MKADILFFDFLEACVHQILYHREVYPKSIFKKFKKFGVPVQRTDHPWVVRFIEDQLRSLEEAGLFNLHRLDLVILNNKIELESFTFELGASELLREPKMSPQQKEALEDKFRASILKLSSVVSDMDKLEICDDLTFTFRIQIGKDKVEKQLNWHQVEEDEAKIISSKKLTPVYGMTEPLEMQIFAMQLNKRKKRL